MLRDAPAELIELIRSTSAADKIMRAFVPVVRRFGKKTARLRIGTSRSDETCPFFQGPTAMPRSEPQPPPGPDEPRRRPEPGVKALQHEDILIATMAGMLAWVITLVLKIAFSG
jgi:hypothetical protein